MPKVVVFDNRRLRKRHAMAPQVQAEVHLVTERLAVAANALFASHDRPGGHRIETVYDAPDGFVVLRGPAPIALEFGHWTRSAIDSPDRKFVKGLHILSRVIGQVAP